MARGWKRKWRTFMRRVQRRHTVQRAGYRAKRGQGQEFTQKQKQRLVQTALCGGCFAVLIALKLLLPGNLATFRAELSHWLVRDADFTAAFHAVGRAVGGTQGLAESLGEAYTAVFGYEEATEVFGEEEENMEQEIVDLPRDYPERAVEERRELPFPCSSPLLGEVTSSFGWREDPNDGSDAFHYGIDIAAEAGRDIACFADGVVGVVGESTIWGNYLTVQHAEDISTLYAHCERIAVQSGQNILAGQTIATVGSTGNATGAHLHFEIRDGADYLDPMYYVAD